MCPQNNGGRSPIVGAINRAVNHSKILITIFVPGSSVSPLKLFKDQMYVLPPIVWEVIT